MAPHAIPEVFEKIFLPMLDIAWAANMLEVNGNT